MNPAEFPHSEISGSKDVCSSPKLIAAYHVFHRLPVPRHSPCALCSLTVVYLSINISYFRFSICQRDFTILLSNLRSSVPLGEIIDFIKNQEFYIANKISFCSSIFSFQGTSVLRTKDFIRNCGAPSQAPLWWAKMDSNHRPHAYQACALTT